jgi:hypothetical protein
MFGSNRSNGIEKSREFVFSGSKNRFLREWIPNLNNLNITFIQ